MHCTVSLAVSITPKRHSAIRKKKSEMTKRNREAEAHWPKRIAEQGEKSKKKKRACVPSFSKATGPKGGPPQPRAIDMQPNRKFHEAHNGIDHGACTEPWHICNVQCVYTCPPHALNALRVRTSLALELLPQPLNWWYSFDTHFIILLPYPELGGEEMMSNGTSTTTLAQSPKTTQIHLICAITAAHPSSSVGNTHHHVGAGNAQKRSSTYQQLQISAPHSNSIPLQRGSWLAPPCLSL